MSHPNVKIYGQIPQHAKFQSAVEAIGNGTAMEIEGYTAVGVQVTITNTATITFEGTIDGTTWVAVRAMNMATGALATTATASGIYLVLTTGLKQLRARVSAWTSGAVTAFGRSIPISGDLAAALSATVSGTVAVSAVSGTVTTSGKVGAAAFAGASAIKYAVVNTSTAANNAIVAAVTSKRIVVLSYVLVAGGTVNVTWNSAANARSGAMPLIANSGVSANCSDGLFATVAGEALNLNSSAAVQVSGHVSYVEVD